MYLGYGFLFYVILIFKGTLMMKKIDSNIIRQLVSEELSRSDVRSIINDRIPEFLREREFEDKIKEITSEVFEKFFKMMYTKRGFWKNDIKR